MSYGYIEPQTGNKIEFGMLDSAIHAAGEESRVWEGFGVLVYRFVDRKKEQLGMSRNGKYCSELLKDQCEGEGVYHFSMPKAAPPVKKDEEEDPTFPPEYAFSVSDADGSGMTWDRGFIEFKKAKEHSRNLSLHYGIDHCVHSIHPDGNVCDSLEGIHRHGVWCSMAKRLKVGEWVFE